MCRSVFPNSIIDRVSRNIYRIADFLCSITFAEEQENSPSLIPSFEPFRIDDAPQESPLFTLFVDDNLTPLPKDERERIKKEENENGDIIVHQAPNGDYQFIIKDMFHQRCCLLQADATFTSCRCALKGNDVMRAYGLNNALMIVYSFAACRHETILIHASTIEKDGWGYAFTARSGVGKSTHSEQWLANIPDCELLNDDNPIVRVVGGVPYIYGSPWSGKTPCYKSKKAQLGAIVKINRAEQNSIESASTMDAFVTILSACATMKWDSAIFNNICSTITSVIEQTPNFNLFCLPDREAALVCYTAIHRTR